MLQHDSRCSLTVQVRARRSSSAIKASAGVSPACVKVNVRPIAPKPLALDRTHGLLQNEAGLDKISAKWCVLLERVVAAYRQACGPSLVGVYLRGSLPKGFFVPDVSDIDTYALVLGSSSAAASSQADVNDSRCAVGADLPLLQQQQQYSVKQLTNRVCQEYKHKLRLTKIEIRVLTIPTDSPAAAALQPYRAATAVQCTSDPQWQHSINADASVAQGLIGSSISGSNLISSTTGINGNSSGIICTPALKPSIALHIPAAFELKTQSVCLAGVDLPSLLPAAAALPPTVHLLPGLAEDVAAARGEGAAAAARGDLQRQVAAAKWTLKRMLRCGFELVQQQSQVWTRDLYWCCHYAGQRLPQLRQQLNQALELYVQLQSQQQQHLPNFSHARQQQELQHLLTMVWQLTDTLLPRIETLFLKQMLSEEPHWLTKHTGGPIPARRCSTLASPSAAILAADTAVQLLPADPSAVVTPAAPGQPDSVLGSRPPLVQIPVWSHVNAHDWCDTQTTAIICAQIKSVLLNKGQRSARDMAAALPPHTIQQQVQRRQHQEPCHAADMSSQLSSTTTLQDSKRRHSRVSTDSVQEELFECHPQPVVLKGLASDWPAVSGPEPWNFEWLMQQGFSGRVRVAPSLQFPFVEPQLVKLLQQIAGPSAAPSAVFNMPAAEFVQRMQPHCQLPALLYKPREFYFMQAQLADHLQDQLGLQDFLQRIRTAADMQPAAVANSSKPVLQFSQVPRLWISPAGAVSPLHYDISHSFLVQIRGYKRMLFFSPDQLHRLYCYPETHLLRRRSRVNVCSPDLHQFPLFGDVGALEVVLGPGDCVFFPSVWAHYTESLGENLEEPCGASMSLTFRLQTVLSDCGNVS